MTSLAGRDTILVDCYLPLAPGLAEELAYQTRNTDGNPSYATWKAAVERLEVALPSDFDLAAAVDVGDSARII